MQKFEAYKCEICNSPYESAEKCEAHEVECRAKKEAEERKRQEFFERSEKFQTECVVAAMNDHVLRVLVRDGHEDCLYAARQRCQDVRWSVSGAAQHDGCSSFTESVYDLMLDAVRKSLEAEEKGTNACSVRAPGEPNDNGLVNCDICGQDRKPEDMEICGPREVSCCKKCFSGQESVA